MDRREITELLEEQDWKGIHARLLKFCRNRGASQAVAEEKTQDAIARVFAFDSEWDPEEQPSVLHYLMGVARMLLFKERREQKRLVPHDRYAEDREDGEAPDVQFEDPNAFGPERAAQMDLYARRIALLRARLTKKNDEDAVRALMLDMEGTDTAGDLAAATGWSMRHAINARDRMLRAAREVAEELPDDDDGEVE